MLKESDVFETSLFQKAEIILINLSGAQSELLGGKLAGRDQESGQRWLDILGSDTTKIQTHWVENIRTAARYELKTKIIQIEAN